MSNTKNIAKNFSWLFIGNIASKGFNFLTFLIIARGFGAYAFGLLSFAQACLSYLSLAIDSGLSMFGVREISKNKEKASYFVINIFIIRLALACALFLISFIITLFLPVGLEFKLLFIFTLLLLFHYAISFDWVFQGIEEMKYISYFRISISALSLASVILVYFLFKNIVNVSLALSISSILVSLVFTWILYNNFKLFDIKALEYSAFGKLFKAAIPLGASMLFIQIYYNLDTIMLGIYDKPAIVGYYNASYKILFFILGIFGIWQSAAFPVAIKKLSEDKITAQAFLEKYLKITMYFIVPITFIIYIFSDLIIQLVFGNSYSMSVLALKILILNLPIIAISGVYGVFILIGSGNSYKYLISVASGALLNIVLNFLLIPKYSLYGASIATLTTEILVVTIAFFLSKKVISVNLFGNLSYLVVSSIISLLVYVIMISLISSSIITIFVAAGSFLLVYVAFMLSHEHKLIATFIKELKLI